MDIQEQKPLIFRAKHHQAMTGGKGMTLVELMVCLVVILVVTAGATSAYLKLMTGFKTQSRVSETYMANMCGMEMLRYDIEMAGFGVPGGDNSTILPAYNEAVSDGTYTPNPLLFNDSPSGVPRPFVFSANGGLNNSDVLVIKSSVAGMSDASKKWSIIFKSGLTWVVREWGNSDMDMSSDDNGTSFIVLDLDKKLQTLDDNSTWNFTFTTSPDLYANASSVLRSSPKDIYTIYALGPASATRMPFNRVDYHLRRPAANFPQKCYPTSSILYRSMINHGDGKRNQQPVLDCVEDFQVTFGLDPSDNGTISWKGNLGALNPREIRRQLREVRVFILYHEGSKDEDFGFSGAVTLGDNQTGTLSTFNPSSEAATCSRCGRPLAMHYRWNVVRLAVKPMNFQIDFE
jgi:prepilin-type N-terminal cleavage/methylation domain-containing protein